MLLSLLFQNDKKDQIWDDFKALPLWRLSETVAEVHSGMQSIRKRESRACLMAASVHLGAHVESHAVKLLGDDISFSCTFSGRQGECWSVDKTPPPA